MKYERIDILELDLSEINERKASAKTQYVKKKNFKIVRKK